MRRALPAVVAVLVVTGVVLALITGGSDPQAPPDTASELVPASARLYLHATTDGTQWERLEAALEDLPAIQALLPGGGEAKPDWMGEEAALARDGARTLVLLEARKETEARAFAGPRGGTVVDGFVVLGGGPGFAKPKRSLADAPAYEALVSKLPQERTAHAWAVGGELGEVERTISVLSGPPGLKSAAFALEVEGDGATVTLRGAPEPGTGRCSRPREAKPSLLSAAPSSATGFFELTGAGCAAQELLGPPRNAVGTALAAFTRAARDVDVPREVLPLLRGQSAFVATEGDAGPAVTFVVEGVERDRALTLAEQLQSAVPRLTPEEELGAPAFESEDASGTPAITVQVGPDLRISYSAFKRKLAISTSLSGISDAAGGGGLAGSPEFERVLGGRPERVSALLFLDLEQLLALGEQLGLADDSAVLAVRDDLQKLRSAGAYLAREGDQTTGELRFTIP